MFAELANENPLSSPVFFQPWMYPHIVYTEGHLPHYHLPHVLQSVTFHLGDSLPANVRQMIAREVSTLERKLKESHAEDAQRQLLEATLDVSNYWLDQGYGSCVLKDADIERIVEKSLLFGHGKQYMVFDYAIMPNHVHALIEVFEGYTLGEILQGIKSTTAHRINKHLGRKGKLWWRESFDRFVRNDAHLQNVLNYFESNRELKRKLVGR